MKQTLVCLLVLLVCSSCTPKLFKGMEGDGTQTIKKADLYPFTLKAGEPLVYSMELNMHDNVVNTLLQVEPDADLKNIRLVCTSVFGTTILDANISEKGMMIYDCADQIKHKKLLRLLEKDLQTLFLKNLADKSYKAKVYRQYYANTTSAIANDTILMCSGYKVKTEKGRVDYKTDEIEQKLTEIATEGKLTKSNISLTYKDGNYMPNSIKIEHPVLKLSMNLELQETDEE